MEEQKKSLGRSRIYTGSLKAEEPEPVTAENRRSRRAQTIGIAPREHLMETSGRRRREQETDMKMHMLWGILCVLIVLLITAIIYEVVLGNGTKETGSQRMEEIAREMETETSLETEIETSLETETEPVSAAAGKDASDSDGTADLDEVSDSDGTSDLGEASDSDGTTDLDDTSADDGAAEAGEEDVSGQEADQTNTVSYQDQSTLAGLGY